VKDSGAHGRRCGCAECAVFRDERASAAELRASYEQALDQLEAVVRDTPEVRDTPALRSAKAFLVEAGRRAR